MPNTINDYTIIEINDKKEIPPVAVRFQMCTTAQDCIKEFQKNHPDLTITQVFFWRERKQAFIIYDGMKDTR
jgi:hypothetical protein